MTAKELLRQYEYADRKVRRLEAEYREECELIDSVRSSLDTDGLPHGNGISKPAEDRAIRLADKALRWKEAKLDAIQKRQEVFELIYDIPGAEGEVLIERYINLRKWEDIIELLHYSKTTVFEMHNRALESVAKKVRSKPNL